MTVAHRVPTVELPAPWSEAAVVVVVPTYNEASNVEELLSRLSDIPMPNLKVVIVDDGSPDGTADAVESFGKRLDQRPSFVKVLRRTTKDGLGRAYAAGMALALAEGAEFIVQMDADLSHQPEYIPQMLGVLMSANAGVVIGSRYVPGGSLANEWKLHRRALSGWANFYVNTILGLGIRDATAGFKLWRRDALEALELDKLQSAGYSFQVEMNYLSRKAGFTAVEIPIHFEERHAGASKMSFKVKMESAKVPFTLRLRHRG
jgi:dolichol-phosphate mannosyltransferase